MFGQQQPQQQSQKDFEVVPPPEDTIACLSFSPCADYLAASSWDNKCKVWEIQSTSSIPKTEIDLTAPALCNAFSLDGTKLFVGGAARQGKLLDISTGQQLAFAEHDAPMKSCYFFNTPQMPNILATGSWDKTLKYWDTRTNAVISVVNLPERCYSMDLTYPLLTIATAERHVVVINLQNPTVEFKRISSPLKYQTRVVSNFPNQTGFAIGSIEGRVGIQYIDDKNQSDNFSFKCHRDGNNVYSVNAISFHPQFGTFSTAGSDGTLNFWDKDSKQRLKSFNSINVPITASCFNRDGRFFAYAAGYDWSKGHENFRPQQDKPKIMIQTVQEADVKGRGSTKKGFK